MKLTLKFGLAFLLGLTIVLASFAWATLRRETDLFWADMRRDNLLTGQTIAAAIRHLNSKPGSEAVHVLLKTIGQVESPVRFRWTPLEPHDGNTSDVTLSASELDALKRGHSLSTQANRKDGGYLLTYVPVDLDGEHGAIEVAEPLTEVEHYTSATLQRIAAATGAVIVLCGLLFTLIGTRLVARPVSQLVEGFRHAASGDLAHPPPIPQHDELGELSREFGILCDALAEARRRAAEETAKRFEALEQLRHADRLRTVGQLTAGVAHELGTPLNVVWARASMIARREVSGDDAITCARIIEDQSQRMTAIIRKLLEFARPRPPQKSHADLRQIIRQTFEVLGATARKNSVELNTEQADLPVMADVDSGQIQQVLSNLVLNAIQAMPDGGKVTVGVNIERAHPPADVGGQPDEFICVYVHDAGPGIADADLPKIFEPFFTTKDIGEGTGLGLSISRGIIHEHGGWIGVASRAGQGTRFNVYLPRGSVECAVAS